MITTKSDQSFPSAKNILNREFESDSIGEKWVSDIIYIRVAEDWNYLTTIIDLESWWSLSEDMTVENTVWRA